MADSADGPAGRRSGAASLSELERERLESEVRRTIGSRAKLRTLYVDLERRIGHGAASALWWAVFGAQDAAET